jgi:hypothetical protein
LRDGHIDERNTFLKLRNWEIGKLYRFVLKYYDIVVKLLLEFENNDRRLKTNV